MTTNIDLDYLDCINYLLMSAHLLEKHDLINIKNLLENILKKYELCLTNIGSNIHYLDSQIKKPKHDKIDKTLIAISGGIVYPFLRKTANEIRHGDINDRIILENEYTSLEEELIPQINKILQKIDLLL